MNKSHQMEYKLTFYLDDITTSICTYVFFTVVCQTIDIFGIVTNVINIICFLKQGFKDSTTISLLGLSISDLASLITLLFICIFYTLAVADADLPFENTAILYLVFGMPHFAFTRVSGYITAFITLERCLSIVLPLKVKRIITTKRSAISIIGIFIIFTFSATPIFIVKSLGPKLSASRNKTIVGLIFRDDKEQVEKFTLLFNNFLIPFCAFIIVTVCTVILTSQLRNNTKWRKATVNDIQAEKMSTRNKKVSLMVVSISTLFISCYVPVIIMMVAVAFVPDMSFNGKYFNATLILGGLSFIVESINSSVNIFMYYRMSSKYRDTFRTLFWSGKMEKYN